MLLHAATSTPSPPEIQKPSVRGRVEESVLQNLDVIDVRMLLLIGSRHLAQVTHASSGRRGFAISIAQSSEVIQRVSLLGSAIVFVVMRFRVHVMGGYVRCVRTPAVASDALYGVIKRFQLSMCVVITLALHSSGQVVQGSRLCLTSHRMFC